MPEPTIGYSIASGRVPTHLQHLGFTTWESGTGFFDVRAKERTVLSLLLFFCIHADLVKFSVLRNAVTNLEDTKRCLMVIGGDEFRDRYNECSRTRILRATPPKNLVELHLE